MRYLRYAIVVECGFILICLSLTAGVLLARHYEVRQPYQGHRTLPRPAVQAAAPRSSGGAKWTRAQLRRIVPNPNLETDASRQARALEEIARQQRDALLPWNRKQ